MNADMAAEEQKHCPVSGATAVKSEQIGQGFSLSLEFLTFTIIASFLPVFVIFCHFLPLNTD